MACCIHPIKGITRLVATNILPTTSSHVFSSRNISTTTVLFAEPLRKKKRLDPAILKARVEKKMAKLEREIAKLESQPKQFIPILEYQLTNSELRDFKTRPGHSLEEVNLTKSTIKGAKKLWCMYRSYQSTMEARSIRRLEKAQNTALQVLKDLDESLYQRTVSVDDTLLPYQSSLMRKETPPNPNYNPPDGFIKDITKKWIM